MPSAGRGGSALTRTPAHISSTGSTQQQTAAQVSPQVSFWRGALHRLQAVRSYLPCSGRHTCMTRVYAPLFTFYWMCIYPTPPAGHHHWGRDSSWRQPEDDSLRHRHDQMHLLRLLPGGVSCGRHCRGESFVCVCVCVCTHCSKWETIIMHLQTRWMKYILFLTKQQNCIKVISGNVSFVIPGSKLWVFHGDPRGAAVQQGEASQQWRQVGSRDRCQHTGWLPLPIGPTCSLRSALLITSDKHPHVCAVHTVIFSCNTSVIFSFNENISYMFPLVVHSSDLIFISIQQLQQPRLCLCLCVCCWSACTSPAASASCSPVNTTKSFGLWVTVSVWDWCHLADRHLRNIFFCFSLTEKNVCYYCCYFVVRRKKVPWFSLLLCCSLKNKTCDELQLQKFILDF